MNARELLEAEERYRRQLEAPLEELLSMTTRRALVANLVAWLLVIGGGFAACLLVLTAIGG